MAVFAPHLEFAANRRAMFVITAFPAIPIKPDTGFVRFAALSKKLAVVFQFLPSRRRKICDSVKILRIGVTVIRKVIAAENS
jgi:hypothetical protein